MCRCCVRVCCPRQRVPYDPEDSELSSTEHTMDEDILLQSVTRGIIRSITFERKQTIRGVESSSKISESYFPPKPDWAQTMMTQSEIDHFKNELSAFEPDPIVERSAAVMKVKASKRESGKNKGKNTNNWQ